MKRFLTILLLAPFVVFAQKQGGALIDSLKQELVKAREDTNKANIIYGICAAYNNIDPGEGLKYAQQALDLCNKLQWKRGIGRAYNGFGLNYQGKSDFPDARKYYEASLKWFREDGYKKGVATGLGNLANIFHDLGIDDTAELYMRQALQIHQEIGDKAGVARMTGNLGNLYKDKADIPHALEYYNKALQMHKDMADSPGIARVMSNMGDAYYRQSNYDQALDCMKQALKLQEAMGNKLFTANVLCNMGLVAADKGQLPQALDYDLRAVKLYETVGNKRGEGREMVNISNVYAMEEDYATSLDYATRSLTPLEAAGDRQALAAAHGGIANAYMEQGKLKEALQYFKEQRATTIQIGDKSNEAQANINIGIIYARQKQYGAAIACCMDASREALAIGRMRQVAEALFQAGDSWLASARNMQDATNDTLREALQVKLPAGKEARLQQAISLLKRSIVVADSVHSPESLMEAYGDLATACELSGNVAGAYSSYKQYVTLRDSVFSRDNDKKMVRIAMQYDYDKQHLADSMKNAARTREAATALSQQRSYTYVGIAGSLLLLGFLFTTVRHNKLLGREKQRSEDLLLNILPEEVAAELKEKGSAGARYFDHVTVLFTDFVNFTQAGEKMSPQMLVSELDVCFKAFDQITARHHVEKIKTIGDAYLAVAGLPAPDDRHAENIVRAAIDIQRFMQKRHSELGDKTFQVRIGIHSGSVVAGIVGVKKFAYDIWGDTVNVAARMEQNSEPGKINISESTYELLADKFNCIYRGQIDAKNKGMMGMYFVEEA